MEVEQESSGDWQQNKNVTVRLPLHTFKGTVWLNLVLTQECLGFNTYMHCKTARQAACSLTERPTTQSTKNLRGGGRTTSDKGEEMTGN